MAGFLDDLGNILAQVAPTAASMLGGPLAGSAVSWVETQLGVTPAAGSSLPDRQQALLSACQGMTGDQIVALRKADNDWNQQLVQAGVLMEQTDEADRASARQREATVEDWVPAGLAITVTAGFFGLMAFMATHEIPASAHDTLETMIGVLGTGWVAIVTYYFGSSSGNARATELLAKAGPVQ